MKAEDELIPTRMSLLSRLKDWKDEASWRVFFDTYWKLIYQAAIKAGLTDAEAQDAVQETVISVLKSMPEFQYTKGGSFKTWLLQLTSWRVADQLRKRRYTEPLGESSDDSLHDSMVRRQATGRVASDLEALWDEEWEKNLVDAAVDRVKREVDPKDYQMFDLYAVKHWPASKVSSVLQVNRGRVYLAKHRIGALIKKEITRLRNKPI